MMETTRWRTMSPSNGGDSGSARVVYKRKRSYNKKNTKSSYIVLGIQNRILLQPVPKAFHSHNKI